MGAVVSAILYPIALIGLKIASFMIRDIHISGTNIHIPDKYEDAAIALSIQTDASHGVNGKVLVGKEIPSVRLTEYNAVSHMGWLSWEVERGGELDSHGLVISGLDFESGHKPNGTFGGRLPDGTPLQGNWTIVMDAVSGEPAKEKDERENSINWLEAFTANEHHHVGHGKWSEWESMGIPPRDAYIGHLMP